MTPRTLLALALAAALVPAASQAKKAEETVVCKDGTTDKKGRGACSGHQGVDKDATAAAAAREKDKAKAEKKAKESEKKAKEAEKKGKEAQKKEAGKASTSGEMVVCKDGSTDNKGRGACSGHQGVDKDATAAAQGKKKEPKKAEKKAREAEGGGGAAPTAAAAAPRQREPAAGKDDKGPPTARCKDGSLSYSKHHTGACSNHGGVAEWLDGSEKK